MWLLYSSFHSDGLLIEIITSHHLFLKVNNQFHLLSVIYTLNSVLIAALAYFQLERLLN